MEDNEFDYNGNNDDDELTDEEEAEAQAQEEAEAEAEAEAEEQERLTFEEQIAKEELKRKLKMVDSKVMRRQVPVLSSQDRKVLTQAKHSDPTLKAEAYKTEVKRAQKWGQFWLKTIQSIAPAIPYIFYGMLILLAILVVACTITSMFAWLTGGSGGNSKGMNSAFGGTGKDFYAIRMVYKDEDQASKLVLNDNATLIYGALDSLHDTSSYTLTIKLTLPEDKTADYDNETANEKIKNLMQILAEKQYVYDNPNYAENGIDLATLTLTEKAKSVKYFGLNTELISTFKTEIVDNFILYNFNMVDGILTFTPITDDSDPDATPIDADTVRANVQSALDAYFASLSTTRSEKLFVRDCVLEGENMLTDVEMKNYVAVMYLPRKNVSFSAFKFYTYGADPKALTIEMNGKTYSNYEEWPVDKTKTMYTYSLDSVSATAVAGYDPTTAVTTATALYKLATTANADNYTTTDENGLLTYKDYGLVLKFNTADSFSFVDEVTLR